MGVENFFYIDGIEKEDELKKILEKKDKIGIEEELKGVKKISYDPIKRRIVMKQSNHNQKALVLEELEIPEELGKFYEENIPGYKQTKKELRIGYYIIDKNGKWCWGQYTPHLPVEDLRKLMEKAKEKNFI